MATAEELLDALEQVISDGVRRGMLHSSVTDDVLDGRHVTIGGRRLVNFGSCSYLGLETHPAMRAGVVDAVTRWGTQFSSSRAYASGPGYAEAEQLLTDLFGRPALITPSTSMGHVAALPVLLGARDVLVLDHQVHHSVQTAAKLAAAQGTRMELLRHGDLDTLERRLREYRRTHRRVWYAADGLYSMYADFLPAAELDALARRHDNLWLYVDDAHAIGWTGRFGRGYALEHLAPATLARTVVAGSLNKSFAAAGGVLTFPDADTRRRVFACGGPLIFSGPVQPPMLGAILASARLHLDRDGTGDVAARQRWLADRIRQFNSLATDAGLPLVAASDAPIRCVGAGTPPVAYTLAARLREAGYYVNTATAPAVAAKRSGARITLTAHHSADDVAGLVDALAEELPRTLAEQGVTPADLERAFASTLAARSIRLRPAPLLPAPRSGNRRALHVEEHESVDALDPGEWDRLLGGRGAFTSHGLRALEAAFATPVPGEPEHAWGFRYCIVRDDAAHPVAATFFTTALWKDDMISPAAVSAEVERLRERTGDPYYLTSRRVAMGSLLTEGDHLYLDRTRDWREALRLVLRAARAEEERTGAAALVLRDLPDGDPELHEHLTGLGFLRAPIWDTWVRELDFTTDEEFLAGLTSRSRWQQRTNVLPLESRYRVESVPTGHPDTRQRLGPALLDHLHELYRNTHARGLDLSVFPLPRRVLDAITATPGWEIILLHRADRPHRSDRPVGFVAVHLDRDAVAPVFCGLDYDHVPDGVYQQVLLQSLRCAQRHGASRVLYGMSAGLHKRRFGAVPEKRWVYVQAGESFNMDVLTHLSEGASR